MAGLELARQTYLFQLFSDTLDSLVMKSRAEGAYDEGICEIKGRVLTFEGDPEVGWFCLSSVSVSLCLSVCGRGADEEQFVNLRVDEVGYGGDERATTVNHFESPNGARESCPPKRQALDMRDEATAAYHTISYHFISYHIIS